MFWLVISNKNDIFALLQSDNFVIIHQKKAKSGLKNMKNRYTVELQKRLR